MAEGATQLAGGRERAALTPVDPYGTSADGMFERLHVLLGRRYLSVLLVGAAGSIPMLTLPTIGLVRLTDVDPSDYWRAMGLIVPWMTLAGVAAELVVARIMSPLRGLASCRARSAGATEAWHAAVTGLPRAVLLGGLLVAWRPSPPSSSCSGDSRVSRRASSCRRSRRC